MCGLFNDIWGTVKQGAGAAGKWLLKQEGVRNAVSKGIGTATSMIPVIGGKLAPYAEKFASKGLDKLNSYVNDVPEGNLKSGLKSVVPKLARPAKTNQYRSSSAVSVPGEGVVYGQNTVPVVHERRNFGDGVTVAAPTIKKHRLNRTHPKQARKLIKRKVRRH